MNSVYVVRSSEQPELDVCIPAKTPREAVRRTTLFSTGAMITVIGPTTTVLFECGPVNLRWRWHERHDANGYAR